MVQEARQDLAYNLVKERGDVFFPGSITSVYIDRVGNIYIESENGNLTYLSIFDEGGEQMANVSYYGFIVYYGAHDIFIYDDDNGKYYRF